MVTYRRWRSQVTVVVIQMWWSSRCGGLCRSSDSVWPGLRAAGGGRVLCFAPTHHTLPMPASERACIPQGVEWSYLLLAGDNWKPLPDNSLIIPWPALLCFALNLSLSKICSICQCELCVGNCLENCPGNIFFYFFWGCVHLDITAWTYFRYLGSLLLL